MTSMPSRLAVLALLLSSCATVCPTHWEVSAGVEQSSLYGTQPSGSVSVGGEIGVSCKQH
jgi:hypothetical protein